MRGNFHKLQIIIVLCFFLSLSLSLSRSFHNNNDYYATAKCLKGELSSGGFKIKKNVNGQFNVDSLHHQLVKCFDC